MLHRIFAVALLALMVGCGSTAAPMDSPPDAQFFEPLEDANALAGGGAAACTRGGLYVSTSDALDRWQNVLADPDHRVDRCLGGSAGRVYYSKYAEDSASHDTKTLWVYTAADGVRKIADFDDNPRFAFASETNGFVETGSAFTPDSVRVTTDAGKTWQKLEIAPPAGIGELLEKPQYKVLWASPTELAVLATYLVAKPEFKKSAYITLFDVPSGGRPKQRWVVNVPSETRKLNFGSPQAGLWAHDRDDYVLSMADGKEIARYPGNHLDDVGRNPLVQGRYIYNLSINVVSIHEFDDKTIKEEQSIKLPSDVGNREALLVQPRDDGSLAIIAGDGRIYLRTPEGNLTTMALQVDNSAVKREAVKAAAKLATPAEMVEFATVSRELPEEIVHKICEQCDKHEDWTHREKIEWMIKEFHKHDALRKPRPWVMPGEPGYVLPPPPKFTTRPARNSPTTQPH